MEKKKYSFMDNHFNMLEKTHIVFWHMLINPKETPIARASIKCKFQTFQLN